MMEEIGWSTYNTSSGALKAALLVVVVVVVETHRSAHIAYTDHGGTVMMG